jgi:hypothetical protein
MSIRPVIMPSKLFLLAALLVLLFAPSANAQMKVTESGYLDTQGFSVILYQNTYHPVFVDEKNAAMQMILHGQRIATNGDVRLMPTPALSRRVPHRLS